MRALSFIWVSSARSRVPRGHFPMLPSNVFASSCERSYLRMSATRSEEHTSELQSPCNLVCRLLVSLHSFPTRRSSDLFDGRDLPAVVAEWFIVELEDRDASAVVHMGVVSALESAKGPLSDASLERIRKLLRAELPPDVSNEIGRAHV